MVKVLSLSLGSQRAYLEAVPYMHKQSLGQDEKGQGRLIYHLHIVDRVGFFSSHLKRTQTVYCVGSWHWILTVTSSKDFKK
jgi:hypothetical protein